MSASKRGNPYHWQSHEPEVEIRRLQVDGIVNSLLDGMGLVVLGARGMGKTVLLRQVEAELRARPGVQVVSFSGPPAMLSVDACHHRLAAGLGVTPDELVASKPLFAERLAAADAPRHIVLLFDEFEGYARATRADDAPGRGFFNDLETTHRDYSRNVGILAAGSMGVFLFRDVLGSIFLSRAEWVVPPPFDRDEIAQLAAPLAARGHAHDDAIIDALMLATGGVPALVTYVLRQLWSQTSVAERDVTDALTSFEARHPEFLRDVQASFASEQLSDVPLRVLELISQGGTAISRAAIQVACDQAHGQLRLDVKDVLNLLCAAGRVRVTGSLSRADPISLQLIPSFLNLRTTTAISPSTDLRTRLRSDLETLLARLHAASADFFRPGPSDGDGKVLVPESVFAAFLAMGLELLGWRAEREAQNVAGRTDIKLRLPGGDGLAVVEVKIWGRHDYQEVQSQVESYWSSRTGIGAVVMLTDRQLAAWPAQYRATCLGSLAATTEEPEESPIGARFAVTSKTSDGLDTYVEHCLLRLPRR